jgi:transposase, IS605 OrfB family, central region
LATVHRACERFSIPTRLSQALAKQAKENVRSRRKVLNRKPMRGHVTTLFYHFVALERFTGTGFDGCVKLIGSGAPRLVLPFKSTRLINRRLASGWEVSKTVRLGRDGKRVWLDLIFTKPRPLKRETGRVLGMDSNYKSGLVFSDGQTIAQELHGRIQHFSKRQKNTRAEIKSRLGAALKKLDLSCVKTIAVKDLKRVKQGKRGTFSRTFNRRLSHWLYAYAVDLLSRRGEEAGIEVHRKSPWKTSQFCRVCGKWDRRNRRGDRFLCVNCGHADHADFNASKNLELLGLAGVYGLRSLPSPECPSFG